MPVMAIYTLPDLPGPVTAGSGVVTLASHAAHPNAAKLFVNWIASREGLETYARAYGHPTTRNDIDEASFSLREEIPRPSVSYFDDGDWRFTMTEKESVRLFMETLFGSR